jgi:DNA repair exonuclease SbcCD nuclease subunit
LYKILTFTDIHLADKNPNARIDNYRDAILNKLEQARDIAEARKVDLALCGGDVFHLKAPSKNSHYLVAKTIEIFKSFPCPIYSVYGNHDISQDNINNLPKQPFFTLLKSKALHYLNDEFFDNGNIRVYGMDYLVDPDYSDFSRKNQGEKIQICVAHVNASSKFDDLFGERVYTYQKLKNESPDAFVFGHYHPDQDIEIHNDKFFINVGSLSRGSLKKDELTRTPNLGYIEIDDNYQITCEKIPLNCLLAEEIFDLDKKANQDKEQKEIEKFINEMKNSLKVEESDDISEKINSMKFEKKIKDKAIYFLDKVS